MLRRLPTHQNKVDKSSTRTFVTDIQGDLRLNDLQAAYQKVVQRHPVLNKIRPCNIQVSNNNISGQPPANTPLHASITKNGDNNYQLVVRFASHLFDDRSVSIFFNELSSYYNNLAKGLELPLPKQIDTSHFIPQSKAKERTEFWAKKLEDRTVSGVTTKANNDTHPFMSAEFPFHIHEDLVKKLRKNFPDSSIEDIITASTILLLSKHSSQSDITIGRYITNRLINDRSVGKVANYLPVRVSASSKISFAQLLHQVQATTKEAIDHQLDIQDIYTSLDKEIRSSAKSPYPYEASVTINGFPPLLTLNALSTSKTREKTAKHTDIALFDLRLNKQQDGSIGGRFIYNSSSLSRKKIEQIDGHLHRILSVAASNCSIHLKDISLLLENEQEQIRLYNNTYNQDRFNTTIPDFIHHLALEHPDREMLVFHDGEHEPIRQTYAEFDILTNKIANHLRENHSLKKGDKVIVSIHRSVNTFAYIFGAMKAGLTPVPIESKKSELFDYKAQNSNANIAIVDNKTQELFTRLEMAPPTINIDSPELATRIDATDDTYYSASLQTSDPAYLIYSSGTSTAIPKKSLLTHGGFSNLLEALATQDYKKNLSVICTAPTDFDAFLFDFLVAWATSGNIHITKETLRTSPEFFSQIVRKEKIDYAVVLPEFMSALPPDIPLRYIITMGAAPREEVCNEFAIANPKLKIYNGWGLTEGGICQSLEPMQPGQDAGLIGKPISNMHMHILDLHMNLCPPEVPGQIYLSGPGLAIEYVDNPELTASKFITARLDPTKQRLVTCQPDEPDATRYFATGDIGYYKENNSGELSVKCVGRADRRIKFCGVSLDLDAIESTINTFDMVESIAVKPDHPKNITALHGFIVPDAKARESFRGREKDLKRELRNLFLQTKLPAVACPQFIPIARMPLTKNGKKAYRDLRKPPDLTIRKQNNDDLLRTLKTMWKEIIGCNKLEDIDNLSTWEELGGHSLGLAALEQKINAELKLSTRINFTFFSTKMTVTELCNTLKPLLTNSNKQQELSRRSSMNNLSGNAASLFPNNTTAPTQADNKTNVHHEQLRRSIN